MSIQVSRSAFRRDGTTINMKPGVQTLKVGVVDVTGVTLDTDYAIDVTSHLPVYKDNRDGVDTTKTFAFSEDLLDSGKIKTSILPTLAKILVSSSSDQATRDNTTVQQGDIDIQQDNKIAYIYDQAGDWQPLSETPTTYTVNVASGTFRFSGKGLPTNLTWSGSNMPEIRLLKGKTYTFDQSDDSNSGNPLFITTATDGGDDDGDFTDSNTDSGVIYRIDGVVKTTTEYETADCSVSASVYTVEFTVPNDAPNTLYIQSLNTSDMGAKLVVETAQDLTSISGNVVPSANGTQDLGSTTKRWNELFLGGTDPVINFGTDRVLPGSYDYANFFSWLKTANANFGGDTNDAFANLLSKAQIEATYETDANNVAKFLSSSGLASLSLEHGSGGILNLGDSGGTIGSGEVLGKINFTSDDASVGGANNVHAYMVATTNKAIAGADNKGETDITFYTGNSEANSGNLSKTLDLLSDNSTVFYNSPKIKQMTKTTFTEVTQTGTGTVFKTQPNGTNLFPEQFAKIVANTGDDNLYYVHRKDNASIDDGNGAVTYEIYEETNLTGFLTGVQDLTTTSPGYAINVSQLKINGVVIDLDNISSNYDFWSDVQATTTITSSSATKVVTPTVVLPALGSDLIPSDATLTNVTLLIKWRLTSNSSSAVNSIDTDTMKIQTNIKDPGSSNYTDAYTFADESYHVPKEASASGDVLAINLDLTTAQLDTLQASLSSSATVSIQITGAKSIGDSLIFRDLSWGLRLFWR